MRFNFLTFLFHRSLTDGCGLKLISLAHLLLYQSGFSEAQSDLLARLPNGTMLNGVRIPRYDENLKLVALIKTNVIEKISDEEFKLTGLHIQQHNLFTTGSAEFDLAQGILNPKTRVITSRSKVKASSVEHHLQANGILYDSNTQQGVLNGPLQASLSLPPKVTQKDPPKVTEKTEPKVVTQAAIKPEINPAEDAVLSSGVTGLPFSPSEENLQALEKWKTDELRIENAIAPINQQYLSKLNGEQDPLIQSFFAKHQLTTENIQLISQPGEIIQEIKQGENMLNISCEGGMFYDAPNALMSYMKNVKIRETRLSIDCSKELRIFGTKVEEKDDKRDEKKVEKKDEKKKNRLGIDKIIAVGNVEFSAKQEGDDGKIRSLKGNADIVEFNYTTGVTILKGGKPSIFIQQGETSVKHSCISDEQWIIIQKNGSFAVDGGVKQVIEGLDSLEKKDPKKDPKRNP
jgi:hypothetical protein